MMLINPYRFVSSGGGGDSDPYFSKVTFLSHFDGASGDQAAVDQKGSSLSFSGSAQLGSPAKFGPTALSLPGNGPSYVQMSSSTSWDFGTGNFTLEMFLGWKGGTAGLLSRRDGVAEGWALQIESDGTLTFRAKIGGAWSDRQLETAAGTMKSTGAYQHLALTRNANLWAFWVDGSLVASKTITGSLDDLAKPIRIGQATSVTYNENPLNGLIDELRVTKGVARYTSAFTPPDAAFPNQ
ncbi:LamG domain-containing protein [Pseudomonas oryzihabitans]|uniref:LamG domain-containing protein n=1 Tax=Pseudomonas oryzihabitans TaxID=47885 RepID=UPI003637EC83